MRPIPIPRVDVLGVHISAINMEMALAEITRWIEVGEQHYVCITGVHGVMESQRDPDLAVIHNRSGLTTPDGMPMVWAGKKAGVAHMQRVYGPDLMLALCRLSIDKGWTNYFYGGRPGLPELLAHRLQQRFPGLAVVGSYSPPFHALTSREMDQVVSQINSCHPHLVWVGLSTPKQERWMAAALGRVSAPVMLGVGAAFDIHAGTLPQAPRFMQRTGLEWLYRLGREPRRLARRYLRNNPRFVAAILRRPPRLVPGVQTDPNQAPAS